MHVRAVCVDLVFHFMSTVFTKLRLLHVGPSSNPMFGADILDTQGSDVEQLQRHNPVWESRSRMEPQGGAPNPLYGSGDDILASRDSLGALRNPLWQSRGDQEPSGNANPLFGTGVLDTSGDLDGANPLFESQSGQRSARR